MSETELYKKKIQRQIKQGILPRYFLAKASDGMSLERTAPTPSRRKGRLTWRQISTLAFLTKEEPNAEASLPTESKD